jgi:putative peptidoglycan lipid II flippase
VVEPLIDTFFPLASTLHASGDEASLRRLLLDGSRATMLLITPAVVFLARHGPSLIGLWVGPDYARASGPVLAVFLLVVLAGVLRATPSRVLLGLGRVRYEASVTFAGALANLALSLILVRSHGIVGVALATLIPTTLLGLGLALPYTCRVVGTSVPRFLVHALLPASGLAAAVAAGMALTARVIDHPLWILLVDASLGVGLLALALPRSIDLRQLLAAGRAVRP